MGKKNEEHWKSLEEMGGEGMQFITAFFCVWSVVLSIQAFKDI